MRWRPSRLRIVNVGLMAGEGVTMDFDLHSMRRIQYVGQTFRTRSADDVARIGGAGVRHDEA
jgi:NADPH2:quinone reductase